jgi:hypothetical protein
MSGLPNRIEQAAHALARLVAEECAPDAVVTDVSAFSERNDDGGDDAMIAVLTEGDGEANEFMENFDELDEWLIADPRHPELLVAAINDAMRV